MHRAGLLVAAAGAVGVVAVAALAPQDPTLGYEAEPPLPWGILLGCAAAAVGLGVGAYLLGVSRGRLGTRVAVSLFGAAFAFGSSFILWFVVWANRAPP